MTYREAWQRFKAYAAALGYREKVVGDEAFQRTRHPRSPVIRLVGARGGKVQVYESSKEGRYEI